MFRSLLQAILVTTNNLDIVNKKDIIYVTDFIDEFQRTTTERVLRVISYINVEKYNNLENFIIIHTRAYIHERMHTNE